jgi:hypothetical protein
MKEIRIIRPLKAMFLVVIFILGICTACSFLYHKTRINVTGGSIPTFGLSGGGTVVDFTIYGPQQRSGTGREAFIVWQLRPVSNSDSLNQMGKIEYGKIPKGFKQTYPENDVPPPQLKEGESYMLQIMTNDAPWGQASFEIRDGKAVEKAIK